MNLFATICLLLAIQSSPALPRIVYANFGPGIREQVRKADRAARLHPRDAEAAGHLGMVLHTYEDHELAAACYAQARRLAPKDFRWIYLSGVAQTALGKQTEAIATLRQAISLKPDYQSAQLKLAEALLAAGELAESRSLFEALLKQDLPQVHYGLGRIEAAQKNSSVAVTHFRKALELFPQFGAAHYALAQALRTNEPAQANEHLTLAQQFKTSRPSLNDPLMAEVAALNQSATELIRTGIALEAAGRLPESIAAHERALAVNPQLTQAHINLIQLYGRTNNTAKAEEHYRAVTALNPNLAESYYNFGVMLAAQKRLAEAAAAFRRALDINPQFAAAQMNYGATLEAQQQYDEAAKHYRLAVEHQPNHRQARFQLARMLIYQNRLAAAIEQLQQTLAPVDEQTPRFTYALGATYARAGERENGLKYLRRAREHATAFKQTELIALIERDLKTLEEAK